MMTADEALQKYGRHTRECELHPERMAVRRVPQYDADGRPAAPRCTCGFEDALSKSVAGRPARKGGPDRTDDNLRSVFGRP